VAALPWRERVQYARYWALDALPHWPAFVVFAVALWMRLWNTFPVFYYGDDAEYAIVASYLRDDWRNLAYPDIEGFGPTPFVSQPPLLLYLFALAARVVGDMEAAATLVCVLLGSLTSVVLYAIGVRLQGRTMGTIAGLFLAVMPYHVLLSRKAYLDVGMAFFMALTILCFIRWLDRRSWTWAAATGIAAAASALSKLPGVLILVPLLVGLLIEFWHAGRITFDPVHSRLGRRELGRLGTHALAAFAPIALMAGFYVGLLWYLKSTVNLVNKLGWQWGRVAATHAGATNAVADHPWHWFLTSSVSSLPAQAGVLVTLLAFAGIALLLRGMPAKVPTRNLVAILWFATYLSFLTLSHRKEWFYIVPLLVPAALLAAAPIRPIVDWFQGGGLAFWRPRPRHAGAFLVVAALLLTGVAAAQPTVQTLSGVVYKPRTYGYGHEEAAALIHARDPDAIQVGSLLGRFTLHFYNGQRTYHWFVPHDEVNRSIQAGELRFVVIDTHLRLDYEEKWMRGLVETHHGELLAEYQNDKGHTKVWVYELHPRPSRTT
jgi:predicted membrane-bound dolichyl-phosphate-mannose-protein mannosyltransferase